MAFDGLRDRIRAQVNEAHNPLYLNDILADASALIKQHGEDQVDTGTMLRNITTPTEVTPTDYGLRAGLGDRGLVGDESVASPSGVIRDFLNDFPQYRTPVDQRKYGVGKASAWWDLPQEGKDELQIQRESGNYGGADQGVGAKMSAYFFQQEGGLDGWMESATAAGIHSTEFVKKALEEWRSDYRGLVVNNMLEKSGFRK
jgi:hypothetical protein